MTLQIIISTGFIVCGAAIMLLSFRGTQRVLALLGHSPTARLWQRLRIFMLFFFTGYLAAAVLVWADVTEVLIPLVGLVFGVGRGQRRRYLRRPREQC